MEAPDFEPIEFELANGHTVRVEYSVYWDIPTKAERLEGATHRQYSAIRIFSTEDTFPRRLELCDELRSEATFDPNHEERIWKWLEGLVAARRYRDYDWAEEFLEEFEEAIARICAEGEDSVEHIDRLPEQEPAAPGGEDAFDPEDDSNFNDQNDSEASRPNESKPH